MEKADVLLIRPPGMLGPLSKVSSSQHPINILYIASYLMKQGFRVELLDFDVEQFSKENLIKKINQSKPKIVGITAMTPLISASNKIASIIKESSPDTVTIVGGAHPTALPKRTLEEFKAFDIAVYGEGEITVFEVVRSIMEKKSLSGIKGIAYRKGRKILLNKERTLISNLDSLPFPARELLKFGLYKGASKSGVSYDSKKITPLFTSRGCPFQCTFCAIHLTSKRITRFRSAKNVISEVEECINKFGINHFTIHDDTFNMVPKRVEEICKSLKKLNITWDCDTRVNLVSKNILKMMADAGCVRVAYGVESGSQRILNLIKKGITVEQVKDAFKWSKEVGLKTAAYFMVGSHPSETKQDLLLTEKLIKEITPDFLNVAVTVPYPGTELYCVMKEKGYLKENWGNYMQYNTRPIWRTDNFGPDELVTTQKRMIRDYYFNPYYLFKHIRAIGSLRELGYWIRAGLATLRYVIKND